MAQRKAFLLRLPPALLDELNRWAKDELRSLNAQIEFVLRHAVRERRGSLELAGDELADLGSDDSDDDAAKEEQ